MELIFRIYDQFKKIAYAYIKQYSSYLRELHVLFDHQPFLEPLRDQVHKHGRGPNERLYLGYAIAISCNKASPSLNKSL
jgi:hypothetical protein